MEYNKSIADWVSGDRIEGFYVLNDPKIRKTKTGKDYLSAVLSDASGRIEMKMWDFSAAIDERDNGRIVKIRGDVAEYRGTLQITLSHFRFAQEGDTYDRESLIPSAPVDAEALLSELQAILESLDDEDYRTICLTLLERNKTAFMAIPAAKSVHHAFLHGLLMHTTDMVRLADYLAEQYSEVINRSLLLAGTFLHDFGKRKEFAFSELGFVTDYSVSGTLLGHAYIGARMVADTAAELGVSEKKSELLQHMLLSHHGDPEFGAAVVPAIAESELLSLIDRVDSRMEIYAENLVKTDPNSLSTRIFALDKRIYHHTLGT